MKKQTVIDAYYVGDQFPNWVGSQIKIREDMSTEHELYEIKFAWDKMYRSGFPASDWTLTAPTQDAAEIHSPFCTCMKCTHPTHLNPRLDT